MTYFDEHFDDREAPAQPEDDGAPPDSKQQPEDSPQDLATRANIARIRAAVDEEIRPRLPRLADEVRRQAVLMAGLKWMRHAGLVADPPGAGGTGGTGRASDARLFAFTLGVGDLYTRCGNAKIALEKHLIQLDNTETRGHPAVRAERKAVVVLVQRVIDDADALVEKAKKLRAMTKAVLQASPPPSPAQSEEEQEGEEAADADSMEEVEEEEVEEEEEEEEDEEQEDGMLEEEEEEEEEAEQPQMPVWEPEHRLTSHRGVPHSALQVRLPGVPLSAVQVEIKELKDDGESPSSGGGRQGDGVLVVHGVKQPTTRQWRVWEQQRQQQQISAPFGRFEVRLDLGSGVVNTSQIRCSMDESGVLTVFLPRQQQHVHRQRLQQQQLQQQQRLQQQQQQQQQQQHQREQQHQRQRQRERERQRQQYGNSRYYSSHPQAYQAAFDPVFGSSSFFGGGRPSRFGGTGMGGIHSARRPFADMCF